MKVRLCLELWSKNKICDWDDLADLFAPHAEHVAKLLADGFTEGALSAEGCGGWWRTDVTDHSYEGSED